MAEQHNYSHTQSSTPIKATEQYLSVLEFCLIKNGSPLNYCVDIADVVEIADFPKVISEVSSHDDFVYGIINIRKSIFIPLYNIAYRLNLDYQVNTATAKVIVLYLDKSFVAILVNMVRRIHNISESSIMRANHFTDNAIPCTSGYFKRKERIIQILDISDLLSSVGYSAASVNQPQRTHSSTTYHDPYVENMQNIFIVEKSPIIGQYLLQAVNRSRLGNNVSLFDNNSSLLDALSKCDNSISKNALPKVIVCEATSEGNKLIHELRQIPQYTMPILAIAPTNQPDDKKDAFRKQMEQVERVEHHGTVHTLDEPTTMTQIIDNINKIIIKNNKK